MSLRDQYEQERRAHEAAFERDRRSNARWRRWENLPEGCVAFVVVAVILAVVYVVFLAR